MHNKPTVLITGVSSGIGRETTTFLAQRGFRVFGTVRNPNTAPISPDIKILPLDVTSDDSVAAAVQSVLAEAGRIDILINCAGYVLTGALEETSIDEARQQFETNFFGVLRMAKAVLPAMRRQQQGRIINISSVLGFLPFPYMGVYAASKHAVEAFTETLDHEIRSFGIRALLVEPSFTKTNLGHNSKDVASPLPSYQKQGARMREIIQQKLATGENPQAVAQAVYRAATDASPRLRYPVGEGVSLTRVRRFVPAGLFDKGFRKQYQLDLP